MRMRIWLFLALSACGAPAPNAGRVDCGTSPDDASRTGDAGYLADAVIELDAPACPFVAHATFDVAACDEEPLPTTPGSPYPTGYCHQCVLHLADGAIEIDPGPCCDQHACVQVGWAPC